MAALMNFPARSAWTLPPGFQRLAPVSPNKVALLGYEWVRARYEMTAAPVMRRRLARARAGASAVGGSACETSGARPLQHVGRCVARGARR